MTKINSTACLIDVSTPKYPNTWAIVDVDDAAFVEQWKWHRDKSGYVRRTAKAGGCCTTYYLARELMSPTKGMVVDHVNGNPLDNRRQNLRICSYRENSIACKSNLDRLYKGVFKHKKSGWESAITVHKKRHYLGLFRNPESAAVAYDVAARMLFGKFAVVNFSESPRLSDLVKERQQREEHALGNVDMFSVRTDKAA